MPNISMSFWPLSLALFLALTLHLTKVMAEDKNGAIPPLPPYVPGNNRMSTWTGAKLGGIMAGIAIAAITILLLWGKLMGRQYFNRPRRFIRYVKKRWAKKRALRDDKLYGTDMEEARGRELRRKFSETDLELEVPPPVYQKPA